jgi:hypothetical protein
MDWNKDVVRRTMEGAGEFPGVQLQLLLSRLEQYPDALPAIADAVRDMGRWWQSQAAGLDAVAEVRKIAGKAAPEK